MSVYSSCEKNTPGKGRDGRGRREGEGGYNDDCCVVRNDDNGNDDDEASAGKEMKTTIIEESCCSSSSESQYRRPCCSKVDDTNEIQKHEEEEAYRHDHDHHHQSFEQNDDVGVDKNDEDKDNRWIYKKENLQKFDFPLGGFGCGNVLLHGDGTLQGWDIQNQFTSKEYIPNHKLPSNYWCIAAKYDEDDDTDDKKDDDDEEDNDEDDEDNDDRSKYDGRGTR